MILSLLTLDIRGFFPYFSGRVVISLVHAVFMYIMSLFYKSFVVDVIRSFYSFLIRFKAATGKDTDTTEIKLMSVGRNLRGILMMILIV